MNSLEVSMGPVIRKFSGLTVLVVAIGVGAIVVDSYVNVPSPPGWLFAWAGWIAAGVGLFGGRLVRELVRES